MNPDTIDVTNSEIIALQIVRLLTNFTRLYLELYDALKGPRRQSTKRNANGRAVPPTPPQPAPTPPVDGQEVLEPDDDYYQSDTDEKRKRYQVVMIFKDAS